eukprot:2085096-Lingulodinium_polyedra.AAC.1
MRPPEHQNDYRRLPNLRRGARAGWAAIGLPGCVAVASTHGTRARGFMAGRAIAARRALPGHAC